MRSLSDKLQSARELRGDCMLFVRAEDADGLRLADPYSVSSVGRELISLSSHTIHHFALISLTLQALGHSVDPDFGVAPSTLRYQRALTQAA